MNKQDLVNAVADASGLTKADAAKAVEATFDAVTGALKKVAMFVLLVSALFLLPTAKRRPAATRAQASQ